MKAILAIVVLLAFSFSAGAHRLDEYLQATRIAVARNRIDLSIDLTPGVAIFKKLWPVIDADGNGRSSRQEEDRYAQRVLNDLRLDLDGQHEPLKLLRVTFPSRAAMEAGEGIIHLTAFAKIPKLKQSNHEILFRNGHLPDISVYLVNALVPKSKAIQITRQTRDERQTEYRLSFDVR